MKVLSVMQPYASLIVMGLKHLETRSWNTRYRGELLIHASLRKIRVGEFDPELLDYLPTGFMQHYQDLPFGKIIGQVNLVDTASTNDILPGAYTSSIVGIVGAPGMKGIMLDRKERAFGDYGPNRYAWQLCDPVEFVNLVPAKGKLGLWDYLPVVEIHDRVNGHNIKIIDKL